MTKKDLKVGMVVQVKDESNDVYSLCMILPSKACGLCLSGSTIWFPLHELDEDLNFAEYKIMKVYDICDYNRYAHYVGEHDRKLLWERPTYYNGKVVCISNGFGSSHLTIGKIYEFVNGIAENDIGGLITFDEVKDFDDLRKRFIHVKFIEVVE